MSTSTPSSASTLRSQGEQVSAQVTISDLAAAYEKTLDCVHCGLCLPACPTYEVLNNEADSPRGRIYLMRAVAEGRLAIDSPDLPGPINRCLDCRACESACPSGVQYGGILEDMRSQLATQGASRWKRAWLGRVLDALVANKGMHRLSMHALALLQRTRVLRLARWLPMPRSMRQSLALLPALGTARDRAAIPPGVYEAYGEQRAEVGLFVGCMMETVFGRVNRAVLEILRHNGCRVHVPATQGCCGALHLHAGLRDRARPLVRANLAAFGVELDADHPRLGGLRLCHEGVRPLDARGRRLWRQGQGRQRVPRRTRTQETPSAHSCGASPTTTPATSATAKAFVRNRGSSLQGSQA